MTDFERKITQQLQAYKKHICSLVDVQSSDPEVRCKNCPMERYGNCIVNNWLYNQEKRGTKI